MKTVDEISVTNVLPTVIGWRLHRVSLSAWIANVRQKVDAGLHQRDLETERVMTGSMEQIKACLAEQSVQRTIPAVEVVLIQLVCYIYTKHYHSPSLPLVLLLLISALCSQTTLIVLSKHA